MSQTGARVPLEIQPVIGGSASGSFPTGMSPRNIDSEPTATEIQQRTTPTPATTTRSSTQNQVQGYKAPKAEGVADLQGGCLNLEVSKSPEGHGCENAHLSPEYGIVVTVLLLVGINVECGI